MCKNKEHLRVAMLGHKRIPSREGGVEIVVEELSTRMVKKGYEVTCYNRRGHHVSGEKYDKDRMNVYKGVTLKTVFTIDRKGLAAVTSSFFASIRSAFGKYDIVHFHAEGPCFFIWVPKLFGKKCIATIHGLDWKREKWSGGFGAKYIKWGEQLAVRFADEIIVLNNETKKYFNDTYKRNTVFIPNGVEKPIIKNPKVITESFGLRKDSYILFLGRIVPEKGIIYLIEAFKQVQTDKKLVIAGGSSDSQEYFNNIRKKASDDERIIFTGFVEGRLLEELYSNAYIYCLPSDLEGMPLSLLEAMSYGNCCLVSDITECTDVVDDKAISFKKGNVQSLKEKLQYLCDNPNIVQRYKDSASSYICEKYNWDYVTDETIQIYSTT